MSKTPYVDHFFVQIIVILVSRFVRAHINLKQVQVQGFQAPTSLSTTIATQPRAHLERRRRLTMSPHAPFTILLAFNLEGERDELWKTRRGWLRKDGRVGRVSRVSGTSVDLAGELSEFMI